MAALDLTTLNLVTEVIVSLSAIVRELIATKSADVAKINELTVKFDAEVAKVASLSSDNETANSILPSLLSQLQGLKDEAAAAIPVPPIEEPAPVEPPVEEPTV
jgi:hypothetical protein